jgi:hypothetical protein
MDCANNQHMRVSVSSFAMRVQWNRVNTYNNKFFIVAKASDGTLNLKATLQATAEATAMNKHLIIFIPKRV